MKVLKKLTLNGTWTLKIPGSAFPETKAQVPGSVYHDLLTAGLIPDPFDRDNEDEALKIMEYSFDYSRTFDVPAELLRCLWLLAVLWLSILALTGSSFNAFIYFRF